MKKLSHFFTRWKIVKRLLSRYLAQKISRRMILNFVGLGVLPIIIVSFVLINLTQSTVQSYLFQRNMETAKRASDEISMFIKEPLTILTTLVQTRDILEMERFTQSRVINKIKASNAIFRKIFILDQFGRAVVTTSFGEEQKDYSEEVAYRIAMAGQVYYSQVYFTPSSFPVMLLALPIKKYNSVQAVLVGEIDLKTIWDLVDNITIGKTGNAFLLSSDGSVIAHPEKQRVLKEESFATYPFFQEMVKNKEGITFFSRQDAQMIAAFASISELGWILVVQQPEIEAFDLARKMRNRVIVLVVLTTLLAILLATATVKRITSPIEFLVAGVREYARGNLCSPTRILPWKRKRNT
ncbi:hypothetical protein B1H10_07100 [candidate division KSB1 bacterium 4484_188]|nr:MAG: hypothetical protein B1H10_07100 [candidate division KSB1 bacterium 4484_188]